MKLQISVTIILAFFIDVFGLTAAFGPPPFQLFPLDPPRFFDNIRELGSPTYSRSLSHGNVKYSNSPNHPIVEVEAGFHLKPRREPGSFLPSFLPPFTSNMYHNFRGFHPNLFTPSRRGEIPESPGQIKNYQDDLKEIQKEEEQALNEITTNGYAVEEPPETPSSYVSVGVTADDNKEYKFNYSL